MDVNLQTFLNTFFKENMRILMQISLELIAQFLIDNKS